MRAATVDPVGLKTNSVKLNPEGGCCDAVYTYDLTICLACVRDKTGVIEIGL